MLIVSVKVTFNTLYSHLRRGLFHIFSANVANKIVAMVSNMVLTRMLTKSEYGILAYVLNLYAYISLASGFGLSSGAFQFGAEFRGKKEEYQVYRYCLEIGFGINFIISVGYILLSFFLELPFTGTNKFVRLYIPIILLEYIIDILLIVLRCNNRFKIYSRVLQINTVLIALCTCIGAFFGIYGVIIGKYLAQIFSLLYTLYSTRRDIKNILISIWPSKYLILEVWRYSFFVGLCSAINRTILLVDIFVLALLVSNARDIASYKVATLIPNALYFIPSSLIIYVLPDIIINRKNHFWLFEKTKKIFYLLGFLNCLIATFLIFFAQFIITTLCGHQYSNSVYPFQILVLGYLFAGTFRSISTNILAGLKCVKANLLVSSVSLLSAFPINYFFIKKIGIEGAAYASLSLSIISSSFSFSILLFILRKKIYR